MLKSKAKNAYARSLSFLFLTVVLTIAVWFSLAGNFQIYRSEISLLFIPKNENITAQVSLIMDNLKEISLQPSFFEKMVSVNRDINKLVAGKSYKERKKYWNSNFEISRNGDSSILTLATFNLSENNSQKLAKQAASTLINTASRYYNIKTEADFRLVGEAETQLVIKNWIGLLAVSSILGAVLAFLLSYIFSIIGEKIIAFILVEKKRIMTLGVGWAVDQSINFSFEFLLYPLAIGFWGLKIGGGIMILLSIILSVVMIVIYDKLKKDWLGIEAIKSLRDEDQNHKLVKFISWLMKKGDVIALIGLSIISEPVKVTLYMRHGSGKFNGFSRRDKWIFLTSVIISNVAWALAIFAGITTVREIIKLFN